MEARIGPITQTELAARAGVAQATIGRLLTGETSATVDTIYGVAKSFGLESWQLLVAGMDPKNPPVLQPLSPQERAFYDNLRKAAFQLAESHAAPYQPKPK